MIGPCEEWTRGLNVQGYGQATDPIWKRNRTAHCIAWEAYVGLIPKGNQLHHLCDNKKCINVKHLLCVTPKEHRAIHVARITHCPAGHEYTEENIYRPPNREGRECRICRHERGQARYQRKKEEEDRNARIRTVLVSSYPFSPESQRRLAAR